MSLCLTNSLSIVGQLILFPGLEGEALQEALRENYRPAFTLSLSQAKDTIYTVIDNVQDSVEGIYSGYTLYLPEGVDASQWLFMNGSGINLEHVFPQSKGAEEGDPGHSDMHHLYPARVAVNEARASNPFTEIMDNLTTSWFKNAQTLHTIPLTDIDAYSESTKNAFEPRETVKGNIARVMFYFYTMYQEDADAADPVFFADQRATLCQWHLDDPIDDTEFERSVAVAHYQDGKENPFVLDCTAALRAWCPEFEGCQTSGIATSMQDDAFRMVAYIDDGNLVVRLTTQESQDAMISVYDMTGRLLITSGQSVMEGTSEYVFNAQFLSGIYTITCFIDTTPSRMHVTRFAVK